MMLIAASHSPEGKERLPADYVPELSRRARGFATWAMIKSLGLRRFNIRHAGKE